MMEYPIFTLSEDGIITTEPAGQDSDENQTTVSGSDAASSSSAPLQVLEVADLEVLQSDVAYLASVQASSAGYLSSTALDTFDRVVQQYDYDYYCAFRNGDDSYNSVLYLANDMTLEGDLLVFQDALGVQLYRSSASGNYNYDYYYTVSPAGDVEIQLGNDLMYYTNCAAGYPLLGTVAAPGSYPDWMMVLFGLLAGGLLSIFFRSRRP